MHAIAAIALVAVTAGQPDLQGAWQGTGLAVNYSLVFCDDVLAARVGTHPILETRESRFSIDPDQGTIDIQRSDGLQLGRYAIEGDQLTLVLSNVNQPRPESLDFPLAKQPVPTSFRKKDRVPHKQQRFVFERAR